MKLKLFYPFLLLVATLLFTQCTIEKRLYTKGWSVERHHRYKPVHSEEQETSVRTVTSESDKTVLHAENTPLPSQSEILQPETDAAEKLSVIVDSQLPAEKQDRSFANESKAAPLEQPDATPPKKADSKAANVEREGAIIISAVMLGVAIIGIFAAFFGIAAGAGGGAELALLGLIILFIGIGIISLILLLVNINKEEEGATDGTESEKPKREKEEKTPEEAARVKRRAAIAMGFLVAAIAGFILLVRSS